MDSDRRDLFWKKFLVWSNSKASDSVMIMAALMRPRFHEIFTICEEFAFERVTDEWDELRKVEITPSHAEMVSRILRNLAVRFASIFPRKSEMLPKRQTAMHQHITDEVERIGQTHGAGAHPIFAATLKDGTFLPCVRASPKEAHTFWVKPEGREPYLQADHRSLGMEAYANSIIHGDDVKSVQPSPYFLPQTIFDKLTACRGRDDDFALGLQMKDGVRFKLVGEMGMSCFKLPEEYQWEDVAQFGSSWERDKINPIYSMIEFHCLLSGLSYAEIKGA